LIASAALSRPSLLTVYLQIGFTTVPAWPNPETSPVTIPREDA
jgi:hypothetical protein